MKASRARFNSTVKMHLDQRTVTHCGMTFVPKFLRKVLESKCETAGVVFVLLEKRGLGLKCTLCYI